MGESFQDVAPYNAAMNVCDKASQWQAWLVFVGWKGGLLGREVVFDILWLFEGGWGKDVHSHAIFYRSKGAK